MSMRQSRAAAVPDGDASANDADDLAGGWSSVAVLAHRAARPKPAAKYGR